MTRDVNLLNHLPPFIREYKQFQDIINSENPEFQNVEKEIEILLNNQFIESCNEAGISRFEKLMSITPAEDDDLQTRIKRVASRWNSEIPYTYEVLDSKLRDLCFTDEYYKIDLDENNYTIEIMLKVDVIDRLEEVKYLLGYILPVNLVREIKLFQEERTNLYMGAILRQADFINLRGGHVNGDL